MVTASADGGLRRKQRSHSGMARSSSGLRFDGASGFVPVMLVDIIPMYAPPEGRNAVSTRHHFSARMAFMPNRPGRTLPASPPPCPEIPPRRFNRPIDQ